MGKAGQAAVFPNGVLQTPEATYKSVKPFGQDGISLDFLGFFNREQIAEQAAVCVEQMGALLLCHTRQKFEPCNECGEQLQSLMPSCIAMV